MLKEGTDTSQGIPQLVSNINACQVVAEAIRTTLGPLGMDKLIVENNGEFVVLSVIIADPFVDSRVEYGNAIQRIMQYLTSPRMNKYIYNRLWCNGLILINDTHIGHIKSC